MCAAPTARGHNLGHWLLEAVEAYAPAQGCARLFLSTTPFLAHAIQLYEHHGFRRCATGPTELFGTPLLTMEKLRPPPPAKETP